MNNSTPAVNQREVAHNLLGRHVQLHHVLPRHTRFLYEMAIDGENSVRWRFNGAVPSFDAFQAQLWPGVLSQFMVVLRRSQRPIGLVVVYNADIEMRYAYIGGVAVPSAQKTGIMNEAFAVMLDYIRCMWPMDKVYMEFLDYNREQYASSFRSTLTEEARLREHAFYGGRYWDLCIYSMKLNS